ncbi:MAG: hypothetical protein LC639_02875 [Idiomarina sp.]|nr:hypothetical protein [Idiomarina sp.]
MQKGTRYIVIALLLILIPLLESIGSGTLWGLNYESPRAMDTLGDIVRLIKLLSVIAGFLLLIKCRTLISESFRSKTVKIAFFSIFYLFSGLQVLMLGLGNLFFGIMAPKDAIHHEQRIGKETFYAYTLDPGPAAKAYHHIYLKCSLPFNRYELIKIGRVGWLGAFDIQRGADKVVLSSRSKNLAVPGKIYRLSLNGVACKE